MNNKDIFLFLFGNYGICGEEWVVPYLFLFAPILVSPFLYKSIYSMSLMLSWSLAMFVYPLFLLVQSEMPKYSAILKAHSRGEKVSAAPAPTRT